MLSIVKLSKIIFLVVIVVSSKVPYTLTALQIENNIIFTQVKESIDAFNNNQNNEQWFIDWKVFFYKQSKPPKHEIVYMHMTMFRFALTYIYTFKIIYS